MRQPGCRHVGSPPRVPMRDRMIALMHARPRAYARIGTRPVAYCDAAFHAQLQALVDPRFEVRILSGSELMVWAERIHAAIARVWYAPGFPRAPQRRSLYANAARFLRIDPARTGVLALCRRNTMGGE